MQRLPWCPTSISRRGGAGLATRLNVLPETGLNGTQIMGHGAFRLQLGGPRDSIDFLIPRSADLVYPFLEERVLFLMSALPLCKAVVMQLLTLIYASI
jgi:hypothetical protein